MDMNTFDNVTSQQQGGMKQRRKSVYDDETMPSPQQPQSGSRPSMALYPSDNVQGSSRRDSHFPRVANVSFSSQPPPQSSTTTTTKTMPQRRKAFDARPMSVLATDPAFYVGGGGHSSDHHQPAVHNPNSPQASAFTVGGLSAQQHQQAHPLAQASAAVALTGVIAKQCYKRS